VEGSLVKSQDNFSFHLNGDSSIDAVLLSKTISDFAELTKLIALEENPDAFIKLNVTAFKNGSFIVDFQTVVVDTAKVILGNPEIVANLAPIITKALIGMFKIKKHLKGETPVEHKIDGDTLIVKNKYGDVICAPKASAPILYKCSVDNLVIKIVGDSNENNDSRGFSLSTSDEEVICSNSDVKHMALPTAEPEEIIKLVKEQTVDAFLKIKKSVFIGPSKWSFIFNGTSIDAHIEDEDWLNSFQEGNININGNKLLHGDLKIISDLDENGVPICDAVQYKVIKVYGIVDSYDNMDKSQLIL